MYIHTVKSGDSLWSIAKMHNVTVNDIVDANSINPQNNLVIGQSLIIPDSKPENQFGNIHVNAYIEPSENVASDLRALNEDAVDHLTYLSIFSYKALENGTLIPPKNEDALIKAAKLKSVVPMMVVTNFRGGTFDTDLADTILNDPGVQAALINSILRIMQNKGYGALNIDFERVSPESRDLLTGFIKRLQKALKPMGYLLSVALAPKTSGNQVGSWYEGHDYGGIGYWADFVIIMTYEWGWSGGPPMAVAPIDQVRKVINYAVTVIPREKIMIGMPLYGYDWVLPYISRGQFARRISPYNAVERARMVNAKIEYDKKAQSPFFKYYDRNGVEHVVWFEDARSFYAKYELVREYGLYGVSYWVLGSNFPQNWYMVDNLFNVIKY